MNSGNLLHEGLAWEGRRHLTPVDKNPTPREALEEKENISCDVFEPSELELHSRGLMHILADCFLKAPGEPGCRRQQAAYHRFLCWGWIMHPEFFDHRPLSHLARENGVSRACLSKIVREIAILTKLRNRLMKREGARDVYRKVQKENHWRKKRAAAKLTTQ